jgi:pilus assembly protein FimV
VGAGSTETMRIVSSAEAEAPTVEQPQLRGGDQALRQKLDAHPGEQTAELAIDDLGLDLGALEGHTDEPAAVDADAPTMLADLDEDTRRMFEGAEAQAAQPQPQLVAKAAEAHATDVTQKAAAVGGARPNATGTWMFTDTDFGAMAPVAKPSPTAIITQISPAPDTASTSTALSALHSDELDLDLGNLETLKDHPSNGLDLDVGAPGATHERPYTDTQNLKNEALVSDDMALPDLEPVTLSEVGTKLDLARAYMDMGDPEGARSILAEVMSEGSMSQKQEARRLMDALPG